MSSTETYNGVCPLCEKGLLQKYETSGYGYIFDACPWCGYVVDNQMEDDIYNYNDVKRNYIVNWNTILDAYKYSSRQDLIDSLKLEEFPGDDKSGLYPRIFSAQDTKSLNVIKEVIKEFTRNTTLEEMKKILEDMDKKDDSSKKESIKVLKTKELKDYIESKELEIDNKNFNIPMYEGFCYFSPLDLEDKDDTIFIVHECDDIITGILKLGLTTEKKKSVRYVSYVNVHKDYRKQGIATKLYKAINDIDLETDTIINSFLTKLGKEAKLNVIFKREIVKYKTKTMK